MLQNISRQTWIITHFVTILFESSVAPPRAKVIQVGSPVNNELYSVKAQVKENKVSIPHPIAMKW